MLDGECEMVCVVYERGCEALKGLWCARLVQGTEVFYGLLCWGELEIDASCGG